MNRQILFLDIDGVLHPWDCDPRYLYRAVPILEQALQASPHIDVVISSGRRYRESLDALRGSVALSEFSKIDPLPVASQPCEYATPGVSRKRKMLNATEPEFALRNFSRSIIDAIDHARQH